MKVKHSLKADKKKGDKLVVRNGVIYRINKRDPRRKARQPISKKKKRQK